MHARDFTPTPDGPTRFIWLMANSNPAESVTLANTAANARGVAHLYAELLEHARMVEAERDKWKSIALKLTDAVAP